MQNLHKTDGVAKDTGMRRVELSDGLGECSRNDPGIHTSHQDRVGTIQKFTLAERSGRLENNRGSGRFGERVDAGMRLSCGWSLR